MANRIDAAKLYVPLLQEAWKKGSITAILENSAFARVMQGAQADEVSVPVLETSGLKDYSRVNGYASGNVRQGWETRKLTQDRGIKFMIDTMDDFEALKIAIGGTLAEHQSTWVIPEIDAYRFAKIAQGAYTGNRANGTLTSATVLGAFDDAQTALTNANVPEQGRLLFCTNEVYNLLKASTTRMVMNHDESLGRDIAEIDGVRIIRVPSTRFTVGWKKDNGEEGGYIAEGSHLNFILLHPSAVCPVVKHGVIRTWTPDENQDADAWKLAERIYHDLFYMPLKNRGAYIHTKESYMEKSVEAPVLAKGSASGKFTALTDTVGATIHYTTDGTTPTASSTTYSAEVTSTVGTTIKAIAVKSGMMDSPVVEFKVV